MRVEGVVDLLFDMCSGCDDEETELSLTCLLCVIDQQMDQSQLQGLSHKRGILLGLHLVALRLGSEWTLSEGT